MIVVAVIGTVVAVVAVVAFAEIQSTMNFS